MKFSHSSLNCYRKCPKMYWWRYVRRIEPIREPDAFIIGRMMHTLVENYYKTGKTRDEVIIMAAAKASDLFTNSAPEDLENLMTMFITATSMFKHMPEIFLERNRGNLVEIKFSISIARGIEYEGYIDRIDGNTLRELKTTTLPDSFIRYAAVSPQVTGYMLGCREMGKDIKSITYDLVRKPLLRKKAAETGEDFHKRIAEDYRTRPEFYYRREYTYRNDEQIDMFQEDLKHICTEISTKVLTNTGFYRNHEACFARGKCPYYDICFSNSKDDTFEKIFYKPVDDDRNKHDLAEDIE